MKKLILMRGPSGSGKSTYQSEEYPKAVVCSSDDYFMRGGNDIQNPTLRRFAKKGEKVYDFNPTELEQAHAWCLGKVLKAMNNGCKKNTIVVDNTFIHLWKLQNYIDIGLMMGYKIEIVEIGVETIAQLRECIGRNAHGVPAEVVSKMVLEFEPFGTGLPNNFHNHLNGKIVVNKVQMRGLKND